MMKKGFVCYREQDDSAKNRAKKKDVEGFKTNL